VKSRAEIGREWEIEQLSVSRQKWKEMEFLTMPRLEKTPIHRIKIFWRSFLRSLPKFLFLGLF